MPIEIISKPEIKRNPLQVTLLVAFIILTLGLGSAYFYFFFSSVQIEKEIENKTMKLAKTPEEKALEEQLIAYEAKISNFAKLLEEHKKPANIFEFIEENCHPDVWFSQFDFNSDGRVSVSGQAKNFAVLEQQLAILKKNEKLKETNLSGISMNKEGEITFSLQLVFASQIFK